LWFLNVVLHIAVVRVAPLLVAIERCGASVRKASLLCIPDPLLLLNSPFVSEFLLLKGSLIATAEKQKQLREARLAISFE
jgi:hypothetical protein